MSEFTVHPWPRSSIPRHDTTVSSEHSPTPPPSTGIHYQEVHDTKHLYSPNSHDTNTFSSYGTWPPHETEQAGLEPAWADGLEVAEQYPTEHTREPSEPTLYREYSEGFAGQSVYTAPSTFTAEDEKSLPPQNTKRRKRFGISIGIVLLVVLGLALGLGLGLGLKKKSASKSNISGAYFSTTGAFNGSGIALASQSFSGTNYGTIVLYFQYHDGSLRNLQLEQSGQWAGGDAGSTVATNVKNGSAISAVSYAMDYVSTWHIFYIDTNNTIRERISSNATNVWRNGPINDLNLKAMDDPNVGLQACWYGSFYGTANYSHSPISGTGSYDTSLDNVIGMHLWYGSTPSTLDEVQWTYSASGKNPWVKQDTFRANGHGGIGCYSWGPGSVSYFMHVNLDSQVQIMWKDLDPNATSTAAHPIGKWVNSSVVIDDVHQNTSLGYTNFFYAQGDDDSIRGYNISFRGENTSIVTADSFTITPDDALPGTHFSVTALPAPSGGNQLYVFNQVAGNDITVFVRDLSAGQWTSSSLPIPKG